MVTKRGIWPLKRWCKYDYRAKIPQTRYGNDNAYATCGMPFVCFELSEYRCVVGHLLTYIHWIHNSTLRFVFAFDRIPTRSDPFSSQIAYASARVESCSCVYTFSPFLSHTAYRVYRFLALYVKYIAHDLILSRRIYLRDDV